LKVRQATPEDVPALVALFQELDRMQSDWRVFTPRPGFYDEVGAKYREAMNTENAVVLVAEDDGEVVGMAYGEVRVPSRFSDERAMELSGVVVRAGYRGRGVGQALVKEAMRELESMAEVEKTSIFGTAVHAVLRSAATTPDAIAARLLATGVAASACLLVELSPPDGHP